MNVLVGPVHFGHVHQAFDTLLDFNERAIVGEVRHFTEQARALRITPAQTHPRIFAKLLQAEGNTILFLIKLEDFGFDFIAHGQHFRRMFDATPSQIGDMQQTINAAQVNERAVVGDVLDDTLNNRTFLQAFQQALTLDALGRFHHGAARYHHVIALAIEFNNLKLHLFVLVRRGIFNRANIHQRTRQERADTVDHHRQTTLDLTVHHTLHDRAFFQRLIQIRPCRQTFGFVARQFCRAITIVKRVDRDFDEIAGLNFQFAAIILEFLDRNQTFRFQSGVHDHHVGVDGNDFGGNHVADTHFLESVALLEQGSEIFYGWGCLGNSCHEVRLIKRAQNRSRKKSGLISHRRSRSSGTRNYILFTAFFW